MVCVRDIFAMRYPPTLCQDVSRACVSQQYCIDRASLCPATRPAYLNTYLVKDIMTHSSQPMDVEADYEGASSDDGEIPLNAAATPTASTTALRGRADCQEAPRGRGQIWWPLRPRFVRGGRGHCGCPRGNEG